MTTKQKKPIRANQIQPNYQKIIISFAVLAVVLIGIILFFSLSQASIGILPIYQEQEVGFAVQIVDKNNIISEDNLLEKLPGEIIEITVEDTKTFPAEKYTESENKASGQVTIINNYSKNQKLVANTRLLTADGKLYRLSEFVEVPAGGQITTTAAADKEGSQFEIGETKLTIPGLWEPLQNQIYAETDGFKNQTLTKYRITENLVSQTRKQMMEDLLTQAKADLESKLSKGQTLPANNLVAETIKYSTNAEIGSSNEEFSMTLGLGVKAVIFDEAKLKEIVIANLPDVYLSDNIIINVNYGSFNYDLTILDENSENLIAQAKGTYTISVANIDVSPSSLLGMSKKEAQTYLENLNDVKSVEISLPFWTKYLPKLEDKINIQIIK